MSPSEELQVALFARLTSYGPLVALTADRVYDNVPKDVVWPYISFGAIDVNRADASCIKARDETLQIDIWSRKQGQKLEAKQVTDAVIAALLDYTTDIGVNALVSIE